MPEPSGQVALAVGSEGEHSEGALSVHSTCQRACGGAGPGGFPVN